VHVGALFGAHCGVERVRIGGETSSTGLKKIVENLKKMLTDKQHLAILYINGYGLLFPINIW
jgi:hypothetical protein